MSVASQARMQMTMRAHVLRNENTGRNAYGEPTPADTADVVIDSLPCFAWTSTDVRENLAAAAAAFGDVSMSCPAGSDVREGDIVEAIRDRRDVVLFAGPLHVVGVSRRPNALLVVLRVQEGGGV